jgi:hypothetical protein
MIAITTTLNNLIQEISGDAAFQASRAALYLKRAAKAAYLTSGDAAFNEARSAVFNEPRQRRI